MEKTLIILLLIVAFCAATVLDNSLAPPKIVYKSVDPKKLVPKCEIHGKPLDLLLVVDTSGSLRSQFHKTVDVVKRVLNAVAISQKATRVAMVGFSGNQKSYFHFNTYRRRYQMLRVVDNLQPLFGLTKTGKALTFAERELSTTFGMRGPEVPKIVFVISDGRSHNHDAAVNNAKKLVRNNENTQMWAYSTGRLVNADELEKMTGDPSKVLNGATIDRLDLLFAEWKGEEICIPVEECVPGYDQPLDLVFVVDSSDSVEEGKSFREQISFIHRVLNNVNVHPDVVRVALITYSSGVRVEFNFKRFKNNADVHSYIDELEGHNGVTKTMEAMKKAFELFDRRYGMRDESVPKMAIVLSDGNHRRGSNPAAMAKRLVHSKDVIVIAVALSPQRFLMPYGLKAITDNRLDRIFKEDNLHKFEDFLMEHVNMACKGFEDEGVDTAPIIQRTVETICPTNSLQATVRTSKPFTGLIFAEHHADKSSCVMGGQGLEETKIVFHDNRCGMTKTPSADNDGYIYNISIRVQFDRKIETRMDKTLSLSCLYKTKVKQDIIGEFKFSKAKDADCKYTLHEFSPESCVMIDGVLGRNLFHKWTCDKKTSFDYLVHDCVALSGRKSLRLLDSDGCEVDPRLFATPLYTYKGFVARDAKLFMFPGEDTVQFKCKISLCDRALNGPCAKMIPPNCNPLKRGKRGLTSRTKTGFKATFELETRKINVLDQDVVTNAKVTYCKGLI